jgi:pre-mRNA-splicing factor CDC5/CEF1
LNNIKIRKKIKFFKGGENVPLLEEHLQVQGGAMKTPKLGFATTQRMQTPNTLLTPFRTPGGGSVQQTPLGNRQQNNQLPPSATPLRDKFNINQQDMSREFGGGDGASVMGEDHIEQQFSLKKGLSKLPAPKNDYEIVLPDHEDHENMRRRTGTDEKEEDNRMDLENADQADLDQMKIEERRKREEYEFKLKSKAVQRQLPRPKGLINTNIIRQQQSVEQAIELNELQKAEEMIKNEMLYLLSSDCVREPFKSHLHQPQLIDKCHSYIKENYTKQFQSQKFTLQEIQQVNQIILNFFKK